MNNLPISQQVEVKLLGRIFDNTSASYKFLLFRSILDAVSAGKDRITFRELAFRSISWAWYAIHFYHLSFGKSDRMTLWVEEIDKQFDNKVLISDLLYHKIYDAILEIDKNSTIDEAKKSLNNYVKEFSKMVPYRLLKPWFSRNDFKELKDHQRNKKIMDSSKDIDRNCLYSIEKDNELILQLNSKWKEYLSINQIIIEGWWKSKFILYLQKNNPTVLSLATKLEPPNVRNMAIVKKLFNNYYQQRNQIPRCLYSGIELKTISHDHFLPWSFLGSDPLYNFVPTCREINSGKSNLIPAEKYLLSASEFHFDFYSFLRDYGHKKHIESFVNDLKIDYHAGKSEFIIKFKSFYKPLFISAKNQGFESGWCWSRR